MVVFGVFGNAASKAIAFRWLLIPSIITCITAFQWALKITKKYALSANPENYYVERNFSVAITSLAIVMTFLAIVLTSALN